MHARCRQKRCPVWLAAHNINTSWRIAARQHRVAPASSPCRSHLWRTHHPRQGVRTSSSDLHGKRGVSPCKAIACMLVRWLPRAENPSTRDRCFSLLRYPFLMPSTFTNQRPGTSCDSRSTVQRAPLKDVFRYSPTICARQPATGTSRAAVLAITHLRRHVRHTSQGWHVDAASMARCVQHRDA